MTHQIGGRRALVIITTAMATACVSYFRMKLAKVSVTSPSALGWSRLR